MPLTQIQGLEDIAVLSILGSIGMLLSVVIATLKLLLMDSGVKQTELVHRPKSLTTPIVAILDLVFTYGGQVSPQLTSFLVPNPVSYAVLNQDAGLHPVPDIPGATCPIKWVLPAQT